MSESPRGAVDEFLGDEKAFAGVPAWTDDHRKNERRLVVPLAVGGVTTNGQLEVKGFPNHEELKFTIILVYNVCIWRLCFATDAGHMNPFIRPAGLPIGPFNTPHYHSWLDNRPSGEASPLPKRLKFANFLPSHLTDFSSCFQWFCDQTNIRVGDGQTPALPLPDRLL